MREGDEMRESVCRTVPDRTFTITKTMLIKLSDECSSRVDRQDRSRLLPSTVMIFEKRGLVARERKLVGRGNVHFYILEDGAFSGKGCFHTTKRGDRFVIPDGLQIVFQAVKGALLIETDVVGGDDGGGGETMNFKVFRIDDYGNAHFAACGTNLSTALNDTGLCSGRPGNVLANSPKFINAVNRQISIICQQGEHPFIEELREYIASAQTPIPYRRSRPSPPRVVENPPPPPPRVVENPPPPPPRVVAVPPVVEHNYPVIYGFVYIFPQQFK